VAVDSHEGVGLNLVKTLGSGWNHDLQDTDSVTRTHIRRNGHRPERERRRRAVDVGDEPAATLRRRPWTAKVDDAIDAGRCRCRRRSGGRLRHRAAARPERDKSDQRRNGDCDDCTDQDPPGRRAGEMAGLPARWACASSRGMPDPMAGSRRQIDVVEIHRLVGHRSTFVAAARSPPRRSLARAGRKGL